MLTLLLTACRESPPPASPPSQAAPALALTLDGDFEWARNLEQVPYCLPIPKGDYARDHAADLPRGSVAYVHKARKADTIEIKGMIRSDPSAGIADYFRSSYAGAEESGKIIEDKKLLEARGLFYARGYWSNRIYDQRFIEITWLRKDEIVRYTAHYARDADEIWQQRLAVLLQQSSRCD